MGKNLVNGVIENPEHLVVMFAADPDDDPFDPATWAKANPTFPVSPKPASMETDFNEAKLYPSKLPRVLQLRLNIWTQAKASAIKLPAWKRCMRRFLVPQGSLIIPERLEGKRCWGGMDLSSVNDLTSFSLAFPWDDDQGIDIMEWYWMPEDNVVELSREHHADYERWIRQGWLYKTPGNVVDYTAIEEFIVRVTEVVDLQDVGFDPRNAQDLVQRLQDNRGITVVRIEQGFKHLSPATKTLERLYMSGRLHHRGNPVTTWQASHMVWKTNPSGDQMPDKKKSRLKIDGFASIVNSIARLELGRHDVSQLESGGLPSV
jgi:phage terminase large subunit-like protein